MESGYRISLNSSQGAIDPICGMTVDAEKSAYSWEHGGTTYHFCGNSCLQKFKANPEQYLNRPDASVTPISVSAHEIPSATPVEYICPMDPDVVSDHPGACPKCGMALEPRVAAVDEKPNPELVNMARRFWGAIGLDSPDRTWPWLRLACGKLAWMGPASACDACSALVRLAVL
jgi:P-type Cu+ transporter